MKFHEMIDQCFKVLRKNFRSNGKAIVDHIKRNHFDPWNIEGEPDLCSFCGVDVGLTKEHVLPKWAFQNDPEKFFLTKINESKQNFISTTIPACSTCNNETLSKIEHYIKSTLRNVNLEVEYFDYDEILNLIRWLEILDYKFHVLNFRRKFLRKQNTDFIPIFRDVPMSIMRTSINLSPYKALSQLRKSQARVKRREKESRFDSLVVYKSKIKQALFFHSMNNYIYIGIPEYEVALFYFFHASFSSSFEAESSATEIIRRNYR